MKTRMLDDAAHYDQLAADADRAVNAASVEVPLIDIEFADELVLRFTLCRRPESG
jgi:hypothetical protein